MINGTPSGFDLQGALPPYVPEMIDALQQGGVALASALQLRIWFDGPQRTPDQVDGAVRAFASVMNRICVANNTWFIADSAPQQPLSPPATARLGEVNVLAQKGNYRQLSVRVIMWAKTTTDKEPTNEPPRIYRCQRIPI